MNQPDRYEKFIFQEGQAKVDYKKDTKLSNAATFLFQKEDHTMGNAVRMQLHKDSDVIFAGYKIPHPLEWKMMVKIQTKESSTPCDSMQTALGALREEFGSIRQQFNYQVEQIDPAAAAPAPKQPTMPMDYAMGQDQGYNPYAG